MAAAHRAAWPLPARLCCRPSALGDGCLRSGCPAPGQARTGAARRDAVPECHPAAGPGRLGGARGQWHQVGRSVLQCVASAPGKGLLSAGWWCPRRYTFDVTKCMFSPGNITEKLRVASLPCAGEVLVDLYAGTSPRGQQGGLARQACRGEQAESGDAGVDSIQMEMNHHKFWIEK